jgi:hypothetical protein
MCFYPSNRYCRWLVDSSELGTGLVKPRVVDKNVAICITTADGVVCIYLTPFPGSIILMFHTSILGYVMLGGIDLETHSIK